MDSDSDSDPMDSDSHLMDSDSGLMDSDSDSGFVDLDSLLDSRVRTHSNTARKIRGRIGRMMMLCFEGTKASGV